MNPEMILWLGGYSLFVLVMGLVMGYLLGWESCRSAHAKQLKTNIEELEKMTLALSQTKAGTSKSRTLLKMETLVARQ